MSSDTECRYCERPVNAAGLCATHRRRAARIARGLMPMAQLHAPIRASTLKVTFDHALAEAMALPETPTKQQLRRVRDLFRRWALCR